MNQTDFAIPTTSTSPRQISESMHLFDSLPWRDPESGRRLLPRVEARNPVGLPIVGAMQIEGTEQGYPIVDSVVRLTPELAYKYRAWLEQYGLTPPSAGIEQDFQGSSSVDSFGFQWNWAGEFRNEDDLAWRAAGKFGKEPSFFAGRRVIDAGCGAGDQSRFFLQQGANVVSADLSSAIETARDKMHLMPNWVGVQGDVTRLPFEDKSFETVYCEGVIQHTRDSAQTAGELLRVVEADGEVLAAHYLAPATFKQRLSNGAVLFTRKRLSRLSRPSLMLVSGILAALSYLPVLGWPLWRSGVVPRDQHMKDFSTTWTNTFDMHGSHFYQRYVSSDEFSEYFMSHGNCEIIYQDGANLAIRKHSSPSPGGHNRM